MQMVSLKKRFRGVKQNLNMARAFWNVSVWRKYNKKSKPKFYNNRKAKKYNAGEKKESKSVE